MEEKVVLVTGSSRGIGKATLIEFAKKGYNVVINYKESYKEAEELKKFVKKSFHVQALAIKADVTDEKELKDMIKQIMDQFGRIDVLVNNAGIAIDKEFEDRTIDDWKNTLNTNLIATFMVSKLVGTIMLKQKSGKMINVSSTNGINTFFPTSIDYDASKAGIINLTHNLAYYFRPYINVNCVAPGWVNTDMNKNLPKDFIEEETEKIYKKRFAEPEEVARIICYLASEEADFINDEVIKIDGGYKS